MKMDPETVFHSIFLHNFNICFFTVSLFTGNFRDNIKYHGSSY